MRCITVVGDSDTTSGRGSPTRSAPLPIWSEGSMPGRRTTGLGEECCSFRVRLASFVVRTRRESDRTALLACETHWDLARLAFVRERFAFFVRRTRPMGEECCIDLDRLRISDSHRASVLTTSTNALEQCASEGDSRRRDVSHRAFSDLHCTIHRPPRAFTCRRSAFSDSKRRSDVPAVASPALRGSLPLGRARLPSSNENRTHGMLDAQADRGRLRGHARALTSHAARS
jgi:hypothetical protein